MLISGDGSRSEGDINVSQAKSPEFICCLEMASLRSDATVDSDFGTLEDVGDIGKRSLFDIVLKCIKSSEYQIYLSENTMQCILKIYHRTTTQNKLTKSNVEVGKKTTKSFK